GTYIAYIRKSKSEKVIDFFKDNKRIERFSFIDNKVHMKETFNAVSYTHLRAHETLSDLVCRLLLEKIVMLSLIHISEFTRH
ncbi:hypothetical protein, partial [Staphylococcus aureus]